MASARSQGQVAKGRCWFNRDSDPHPQVGRMVGESNADTQEIGRGASNRVENSHLPFPRRERAMTRLRDMRPLQKFASVHAHVHNHFSLERDLVDRQTCKERRSAALAA